MSKEAKAEHMLDEAKRLVSGSRNEDYGPPDVDMAKVAGMMNHLFGWDVKPSQVPMIMILIKLARESHSSKHDNAVDIAGWAWCMDECAYAEEINAPWEEPDWSDFDLDDTVELTPEGEAALAEGESHYVILGRNTVIQEGDQWRVRDSGSDWKPTICAGEFQDNHSYLEYRRKIF